MTHPCHTTSFAYVGGNPLESHHGHGPGVFSNRFSSGSTTSMMTPPCCMRAKPRLSSSLSFSSLEKSVWATVGQSLGGCLLRRFVQRPEYGGSVSENGGISLGDFRTDGFFGVAINPRFTVRHVGVCKDRINGTFGDACATVDALIGVDDKVGLGFSKGFYRANGNAFLVFVVNARM